jgi:iron complex outermembrane receptor protein
VRDPDTRIDAGNRIPATAPDSLWAELRWTPAPDVDCFAQANAVGRVYADDSNSAHAPGYATLDVGVERRWRLDGWPGRASRASTICSTARDRLGDRQ